MGAGIWFFYEGAVAEKIGSGLQNRVHRCESGPRLQFLAKQEIVPRMRQKGAFEGLLGSEITKMGEWRNWQTQRT